MHEASTVLPVHGLMWEARELHRPPLHDCGGHIMNNSLCQTLGSNTAQFQTTISPLFTLANLCDRAPHQLCFTNHARENTHAHTQSSSSRGQFVYELKTRLSIKTKSCSAVLCGAAGLLAIRGASDCYLGLVVLLSR